MIWKQPVWNWMTLMAHTFRHYFLNGKDGFPRNNLKLIIIIKCMFHLKSNECVFMLKQKKYTFKIKIKCKKTWNDRSKSKWRWIDWTEKDSSHDVAVLCRIHLWKYWFSFVMYDNCYKLQVTDRSVVVFILFFSSLSFIVIGSAENESTARI